MSAAVEPHEVEALRAAEQALDAAGVEPRDFSQPRRFSAVDRALMSRAINLKLPHIAGRLGAPLRQDVQLTLAALEEVNADALFEDLEEPFFVVGFTTDLGQGWALWEAGSALFAVEAILAGATEAQPEPRRFSPAERRLVLGIVRELVTNVAEALGTHVLDTPLELAQKEEELRTLELEPGSDPRRLLLHVSFEGPGGASDLRFYFPGVVAKQETHADAGALPEHLESVLLTLSARLGELEVPLSELLSLEEGDVLPIGQPVGSAVELWIEERSFGSGQWGNHDGQLAVVVSELTRVSERRAEAEPDTDRTSPPDPGPVDGNPR